MKFLNLKLQYRSIKVEIDRAIRRILDKGVFIGGDEVKSLEEEIAKFCGIKYGVSVNSGTDALSLSLKVLEIKPGDEVITSPFTFIATAEVIADLGAKPVFVDIDAQTFNINTRKIEEVVTEKTKAIIPIHLFGQISEMSEIIKISKKHKLYIVEDAAQAIGAEYKGKKAGTIGDLGCFSFFPSKNLGAYGDGGMIVTNNRNLADKVRLLKNHGSSPKKKYLNLDLGTNSRLDAIQAAILRVKLKHLNEWNRERKKVAEYYDKNLRGIGDVITPIVLPARTHVFHQYTIRIKHRDQLRGYLKEKGIPTMIYYPLSLHSQPCFEYLNYRKNDFPEAEKAATEVLSLPVHPDLKRGEQDFIIQKIKEFFL